MGGHQAVGGEHPQAGRAVNEDIIIGPGDQGQVFFQGARWYLAQYTKLFDEENDNGK